MTVQVLRMMEERYTAQHQMEALRPHLAFILPVMSI